MEACSDQQNISYVGFYYLKMCLYRDHVALNVTWTTVNTLTFYGTSN